MYINPIEKQIIPFEKFDIESPEWFKIYSRYKHDKINLLKYWNLKHCLYSLGCLLLLVINHPSNDHQKFRIRDLNFEIFSLLWSKPKFCGCVEDLNGLVRNFYYHHPYKNTPEKKLREKLLSLKKNTKTYL